MARRSSAFTVDAKQKDFFFDRLKVIESMSAQNVKRLSKAGAFVRTRARSILRRRKKPSKPGASPTVWSRDEFATLKNILFYADVRREAVIIGPRAVPGLALKGSNRRTVPELLEKGGWVQTRFKMRGKRYVPSTRSIYLSLEEPEEVAIAKYEPRPFMGPALSKVIAEGKVGNLWSRRG